MLDLQGARAEEKDDKWVPLHLWFAVPAACRSGVDWV
jgi:hypothetical protein